MIKTQRIIKYCAIAFAIFLIFNILSVLMYGIIAIGNIFDNSQNGNNTITDKFKTTIINNEITKLDIETKGINIIIKEGKKFKLETDNKDIKIKESNKKLLIIEDNNDWLNKNDYTELIISIPKEYRFDEVFIDNGAGKIEIDTLNTKDITLDLGAGQVDIENLNVSNESDINGGAGEINIINSSINNLDLDLGIGKTTINSGIYGDSEIDCGIGELIVNLIGTDDDYKIKLNKGLGSAELNDEKMKNDIYYGNGNNIIEINGGIGSISINYSR